LAQLLKEQVKSVFVITSSVPAALELSSGGYGILLLGGMVRNKSLDLLGRETLRIIERYRADKAFLGSTGFTAEMGHSTPNPDDAQIKEALIRIADKTYVLVDSSKYGHNCLTSFVQLHDVHLTITDNRLPRVKAKTLEAVGAKLRIAEVVDKAHLNREPAGASGVSTAIETPLKERPPFYSLYPVYLNRLRHRRP
jgi:DeoR/GlpR family transcriptional regulator of sugar metabolism